MEAAPPHRADGRDGNAASGAEISGFRFLPRPLPRPPGLCPAPQARPLFPGPALPRLPLACLPACAIALGQAHLLQFFVHFAVCLSLGSTEFIFHRLKQVGVLLDFDSPVFSSSFGFLRDP